MKDMSLIKKFSFLGALIAFALVILFFVTIDGSMRIKSESQYLSVRSIPALEQAYKLQIAVIQVQQFFTDAGATRQQSALHDDTQAAEGYARSFRKNIALLIAGDKQNKAKYEAMLKSFNQYYQTGLTMAQAYVANGTDAGNQLMGEFDATASRLAKELVPFLATTVSQTHAKLDGQNQRLAGVMLTEYVAFAIIFILFALGGMIMLRTIKKIPLVASELQRISKGDLSGSDLHHFNNDEVGQLCNGLNVMRAELKNVMNALGKSSDHVATSAQQLLTSTEQTDGAIALQSTEVARMATAMDEMSTAAQEVAHHASDAAEAARQADEEVKGGSRVVLQAVESIKRASDAMEQAEHAISKLDRDSDNIGSILDVIRGIADQTNLLALNAAIEAARAGEQGRGFAVVAEEVRSLAQRSQDSTQEIQKMIEGLQTGAKDAVQVMDGGRTEVVRSVDLAGVAGDRLSAIAEAVTKISDMTAQIATAAEEQSSVANEMNANVHNINTTTEQTADMGRQTAESGRALKGLANQLQQLVKRFSVQAVYEN